MKKNRIVTFIFILIILVGLSLLLYPTVSNYWNAKTQSKAVAEYSGAVAGMDEEKYEQILQEARDYNKKLSETTQNIELTAEQEAEYRNLLSVSGRGIMGSVEIPRIGCDLPIYHGTEESVLQIAIGHLEWTSLPVGGESTHCVISGHRGLPSAQLFTDLDELEIGDIFMLRVLNETLTYEVDQILIVEPQEIDALTIADGEDYCTLMTCTPYGVNSHRLLVRGHRVENMEDAVNARVISDAIQVDPMLVALLISIPIFLVMLVIFLRPRRNGTMMERDDEDN